MSLTPLDIHNKDFPKKTFGGYDKDAVDDFLDQVMGEFDRMIKENDRLKTQIEDLNMKLDQYRSLEETINKTLVVAQEAAEEVKANAKKNADLIIQEARLQAERIIETGQVKARRIMEENADLARAAHTLRTQVKSMLQAQLEAIDGLYDPFAKAAAAQMSPEGHKE
ncbi:MAG TPA: DivIVA domain-containing protein [Symbiobacteriaceae bacterium]|nr:DivIVA domain-containing protein [Symbiobacteriaceae bacterium]